MEIDTQYALNPTWIGGDQGFVPTIENLSPAPDSPTGGAAGHSSLGAVMSDAEIALLVSQSLEDALLVMDDLDPEATLRTRARGRRRASHRILASLPQLQSGDATVRAEFRKAILMQDLSFDIALEIVGALRRYARAAGVTGAVAMT